MDTMILYMSLARVVATVLDFKCNFGRDLGPNMFQVTWVLPATKLKASASTALVPVSSEKGSTSSAGISYSRATMAGVSEGTVIMPKKTVVIKFKIFFGCALLTEIQCERFPQKYSQSAIGEFVAEVLDTPVVERSISRRGLQYPTGLGSLR